MINERLVKPCLCPDLDIDGEIRLRMRPASGAAKFCLVAEGKADLHARSTGYFEWDCAAGDALFRSQGLAVRDIVTGRPLTYNGPNLRIGGLIASRIPT